jgi:hypothetical protein
MPLPTLVEYRDAKTALADEARLVGLIPMRTANIVRTVDGIRFESGWDSSSNNTTGMTAQQIADVINQSQSDTVREAAQCGIVTVMKGCHPAGPHITIRGERLDSKGRTMSKAPNSCSSNGLFETTWHIDCATGLIA